jgi:hypothetical protein
MKHIVAIVVFLSLCAVTASAGLEQSDLPQCWKLNSTYDADAATLRGFGGRFGVELDALSNYKIDAGGIPLQVNVVVCKGPEDAKKVHDFFMTARDASPQKYVREDHIVYEFLCDNHGVRAMIQEALGIRPTYERLYRVTMEVAPLAAGDGMLWNALFNALTAHRKDPGDEATTAKARGLAGKFQFGDAIALRNEKAEWGTPSYTFSIEPTSQKADGDVLSLTFEGLPRTLDVPRVTVTAKVPVRSFGVYQPSKPVNTYELTRATAAWPTGHPLVVKALEGLDESWPARKKIEYIQCWVFDNIRYDGDVVGSRYGTAKVLEQGYGHCWDKADAFVTICRAAGVPAREVMGWNIVFNSGHVWAQAYDEREGWISIDATASWPGTDETYIPLFILEDGRVPFVYTAMPEWMPLRQGG